jgi:hypothetical protein
MATPSLRRILLVLALATASVVVLAVAAHADINNSRVDQATSTTSCAAEQGTLTEAPVASGSASSCAFGGGVEACEYSPNGDAAGSGKNCTRITGKVGKRYVEALNALMARVNALSDGSLSPPDGTGTVVTGRKITVKVGQHFHEAKLKKTCENSGGSWHPDQAGGGGSCSLPNGHNFDCWKPRSGTDQNCTVYRTKGTKPLVTIIHDLVDQIDAASAQTPSGGTGGGGSSATTTSSTTTTTKPTTTTTKPTTTTTKPPTPTTGPVFQ